MRGKVEQIYLKYFDAAKMRGKVGTLIRDKMNRLHVLTYYRLKEHHESWKVKVWKERQIFFHFPDQRIDSKYLEFNIFRLWLHFFDTRGCLRRKFVKQILLRLSRRIFWVQWWPSQTPPSCFLHFFSFFSCPNLIFLIFLYSWRVHTTLRKILDTLDDKPQRNNLSKLGTLKYEFPQLRHSALTRTALLASSVGFELLSSSARVTSVKSANSLGWTDWLTDIRTHRSDPRDTWVR